MRQREVSTQHLAGNSFVLSRGWRDSPAPCRAQAAEAMEALQQKAAQHVAEQKLC